MHFRKYSVFLLIILVSFLGSVFAQKAKQSDGSPSQRLSIMSSKLETMKRSLNSAISTLKQTQGKVDKKDKKDDKAALETPIGRLQKLEKDASKLDGEVSSLRGKVDRSEKYDSADLDQLEVTVNEFQGFVDNALLETAQARATPISNVGNSRDIKKKKKFLWIFGGKGNEEYDELLGKVVPGRDRELFVVATREVRKGNHEVGRLLFQTIITTYPDSPYLAMAKLAVADSFYLEAETSNLIQAAVSYQDWLTFFPTHPLADRVLLKIAECEMRQVGLPDRSSEHARRAEQKLKVLIQQYPNTLLRGDVDKRLSQVQDNLGLHDLQIGNYYYALAIEQKKSGLKGAQSRYREILQKYPNFGYMDEALFKLAVTYQVEEETDEAIKYFQRVVSDYPGSDYVGKSKQQLELMGAKVPATNPARANWAPPENKGFFTNFKENLIGSYTLTIDKNGVLMTRSFDKAKFDLIDAVIENLGELPSNQIPKTYTTVIRVTPKTEK